MSPNIGKYGLEKTPYLDNVRAVSFPLCGEILWIFMQLNMLMTLCDSLIIVLLALTLARSFIILKIMTMMENKNKSYIIILMSFLRSWSDHETMNCNHDHIKIEKLLINWKKWIQKSVATPHLRELFFWH